MKIQRGWDRIQSQFQSFHAAEEIVGGVHGSNRLGDHSLLDFAIFGRAATAACASHVLGDTVKVTSLAFLANEGKAERSKSDHAIVVGGDLADTLTDNTVLETMAAWCGWAIRRSVVSIRM